MVSSLTIKKNKDRIKRKLKKGDTVKAKTKRGTSLKIKLSHVKKPGPGKCLTGHIMGGVHKGKKIKLSRKEAR
jgi:hypothetical protein